MLVMQMNTLNGANKAAVLVCMRKRQIKERKLSARVVGGALPVHAIGSFIVNAANFRSNGNVKQYFRYVHTRIKHNSFRYEFES